MQLTLTPMEARVLGALIEKEITTPEYYPLSLNALSNACNQKSNRDPVLHVEESEVRKALNHLEYQSLVRSVSSTDSRVTKFEHRLQDAFNFYRPEVAIVCELLLRGPQTAGELRTRASRMHPFEDLESVHSALQRLSKRDPPLLTVLPRQSGMKEARYAHLMSDRPLGSGALPEVRPEPSHSTEAKGESEKQDDIASLARELDQLRAEVAD